MKTRKFVLTALVSLLLPCILLAQGAREIASDEYPMQITEASKGTRGGIDLTVVSSDGMEIVYHTSADTISSTPIEYLQKGDIILVKDDGIATMSLPPQMFAKEIRNITIGVQTGIYDLSFPTPVAKPAVDRYAMWDVTLGDDMISRFNYAYGYSSMQNFLSQGLTIHGAFFCKGIIDCMNDSEPLIAFDAMSPIVDQYIAEIYNKGIPQDAGATYGSYELLESLELGEALEDRFAYSYGYMVTASLLYQGIALQAQPFCEGLLTCLYGKTPVMTDAEMTSAIQTYAEELNKQYEQQMAEIAQKNLDAATAFLDSNKSAEGIITLPDGLQYKVTVDTDEDSATPALTDSVTLTYTLRDLDGNVLDQGADVTFALKQVIPGFAEAVAQMKVGQTVRAYIPPELGYGVDGANSIQPNTLLVFDIELTGIEPAAPVEEVAK